MKNIIFIKMTDKQIQRVFTEGGKNRDKLSYFNRAKPFWDSCMTLLQNKLYNLEQQFNELPAFTPQSIKDEIAFDIAETKNKLQEALDCKTDLAICSYYCKFHNIEYKFMEVWD